MSDRLSPLDSTFLELEDADPAAHMHIGGALVFDPLPATGAPPDPEAVAAHIAERLLSLPRYSDRLSSPSVGPLRWPEWVPDEHFDITRHVRRAALPAPGGRAELEGWLSHFFALRLDRAHPLWEAVIVEGLSDGRWVLATKTHHCLVDGVGAADVGTVLLDATPDAAAPARPRAPHRGRRDDGIDAGLIGDVARAGFAVARTGFDAVRDPRVAWRGLGQARAALELLVRDEVVAAPSTSINVPIGVDRRYAAVTLPIAELAAVGRDLGGTVNDVVLALVAGGIHDLLVSRGEPCPEEGIRAMVPVNRRPSDDDVGLGNRVSSLFVHLPVAIDDPVERLAATIDEAERLKAGSQSSGSSAIISLAGYAPPVVHSRLARSLFASRLFNVTVTNVPGSREPLYACGARLSEVLPLVPLASDHALGVAAFSYAGALTLGVVADRDAMADLDVFLDSLREGTEELRTQLTAGGRRTRATQSNGW